MRSAATSRSPSMAQDRRTTLVHMDMLDPHRVYRGIAQPNQDKPGFKFKSQFRNPCSLRQKPVRSGYQRPRRTLGPWKDIQAIINPVPSSTSREKDFERMWRASRRPAVERPLTVSSDSSEIIPRKRRTVCTKFTHDQPCIQSPFITSKGNVLDRYSSEKTMRRVTGELADLLLAGEKKHPPKNVEPGMFLTPLNRPRPRATLSLHLDKREKEDWKRAFAKRKFCGNRFDVLSAEWTDDGGRGDEIGYEAEESIIEEAYLTTYIMGSKSGKQTQIYGPVPLEYLSSPAIPESLLHLADMLPDKFVYNSEYTLVLALDNTLICTSDTQLVGKYYEQIIELDSDNVCYMYARPHLLHFLKLMKQDFEIIVYTTAQPGYAKQVVDWLHSQQNNIVEHILHQYNCLEVDGQLVKCVARLGRDLTKTVLIDNDPLQVAHNWPNALWVEKWTGDDKDDTLFQLREELRALVKDKPKDIRPQLTSGLPMSAYNTRKQRRFRLSNLEVETPVGVQVLRSATITGEDTEARRVRLMLEKSAADQETPLEKQRERWTRKKKGDKMDGIGNENGPGKERKHWTPKKRGVDWYTGKKRN
ncbi:uncharacterized protein LOC135812479 [Sycon ciliatum]|uniref:uncharacterized protein LOC135812479 n=1 Tax=Sycon ciliatum TaxID=27933 RepID=UPI0031F636C8